MRKFLPNGQTSRKTANVATSLQNGVQSGGPCDDIHADRILPTSPTRMPGDVLNFQIGTHLQKLSNWAGRVITRKHARSNEHQQWTGRPSRGFRDPEVVKSKKRS